MYAIDAGDMCDAPASDLHLRTQDMGNSNYSMITAREKFNRRTAAAMVVKALHQLDVPVEANERNDITLGGKKVSGSAYKIIGQFAYHHGTMLIDTDPSQLRAALHGEKVSSVVIC
jgi:lipoate-protein ligase A